MDQWDPNNIADNDAKICKKIKELFDKWVSNYNSVDTAKQQTEPTEEQKAQIEYFKKQGWM